MVRRATHWLHIAIDSGLPGLALIVGGCIFVTLKTAQNIDADEAVQVVSVTCLGALVAAYRVWSTNRKRSNRNG